MSVKRSHNLSIGIVGLPNSGKSTLFNALTSNSVPAENYPFCTIDTNIGVVTIEDARLQRLAEMYKSGVTVPSAMTFVDIAGLVKGASKGEGLGNQFLGHIRQVDAVMYVLRAFRSERVTHVYDRVDPVDDFTILQSELILKDLETVGRRLSDLEDKMKSGKGSQLAAEKELLERIELSLNGGIPVRTLEFTEEEGQIVRDLWLLTSKPSFYLMNVKGGVDGSLVSEWKEQLIEELPEMEREYIIAVDSKMESEMDGISEEERSELSAMVEGYAGVQDIVELAFRRLDLITFYTCDEKRCHAWTIQSGATVKEAAGVIHSDFEKNFVAAEILNTAYELEEGGWNGAKEKGRVRNVGREYIVKDGDHVHILATK
jgi:ribosome-binding ATPase